MELHFNQNPKFTDWIVETGALHEPFVLVDVGVQGGESPRWHRLRDHLVVTGFDAIKEVVEALRQQNSGNPNRNYHWIAAGSADEERDFYFNAIDPWSSSLYPQGADRFATARQELQRKIQTRRLDTLLSEGVITPADFIKVDVEGFEKDVFLGAQELLRSALGVETETNFNISPTYPKSHFGTLQELLLQQQLLVFDLSFYRVPRASFRKAIERKKVGEQAGQRRLGRPATLNVLFCRNPIDEADHRENYLTPCRPLGVDQLIKIMIIYELYGLNDVALDTAERFGDRLVARFDVEKAIALLADPFCRTPGGAPSALVGSLRATTGATAVSRGPLRALRRVLGNISRDLIRS